MTLVDTNSTDMEIPLPSSDNIAALLNNATLAQPAVTPANYSFSPEGMFSPLLIYIRISKQSVGPVIVAFIDCTLLVLVLNVFIDQVPLE